MALMIFFICVEIEGGENSNRKTSFIHLLHGIGNIIPPDVGPITAWIVKIRYAETELK